MEFILILAFGNARGTTFPKVSLASQFFMHNPGLQAHDGSNMLFIAHFCQLHAEQRHNMLYAQ